MYVPFREITCCFPDHKLNLCVLKNSSSPGAPNVIGSLGGETGTKDGGGVGLLGGGNSVVQVSTSL